MRRFRTVKTVQAEKSGALSVRKTSKIKKSKKFEKTFKKVLTKPKRCGIITTSSRERVKNNKEPQKRDRKIV